MLRKVWSDYLERIRPKMNKEHFVFAKVWVYVYMLVLLPCMIAGNGKGIGLGQYYFMVIPMLFGMYSMNVVPIQLPKQMFLCPMAEWERKSYARQLYWLRFLVTVVLGLVFHGAGMVFGIMNWKEALIQQLGLTSMMLCISISTFPGSRWDGGEEKDRYYMYTSRMKGLGVASVLGLLISLFYKVILVYNVKWQWQTSVLFRIYSIASVAGMVITSIWVLFYLKPFFELITDYEYSYDVWKSQKVLG